MSILDGLKARIRRDNEIIKEGVNDMEFALKKSYKEEHPERLKKLAYQIRALAFRTEKAIEDKAEVEHTGWLSKRREEWRKNRESRAEIMKRKKTTSA